jgi:hypothetical protein
LTGKKEQDEKRLRGGDFKGHDSRRGGQGRGA